MLLPVLCTCSVLCTCVFNTFYCLHVRAFVCECVCVFCDHLLLCEFYGTRLKMERNGELLTAFNFFFSGVTGGAGQDTNRSPEIYIPPTA